MSWIDNTLGIFSGSRWWRHEQAREELGEELSQAVFRTSGDRSWQGQRMKSIKNAEVAAVFEGYPRKIRRKLLALRKLVFETAESTEGVGQIEETLKWGEPAYVTSETGSGSTIRIGWKKSTPTRYAIYFHCQTNLVETFRELFPNEFKFEGNRGIVFGQDDPIPAEPLSVCIATALTYHLRKRSRRR